ncbi:hypothetical protein BH23ACT9_BH23ACT9_20110 [soil metagenome]
MGDDGDDDLRKVIRDFRSSVSAQFDEHGRRLGSLEQRMEGIEGRVGELTEEFRTRTQTMETAILHAIRDLARDMDRRLTRLEG